MASCILTSNDLSPSSIRLLGSVAGIQSKCRAQLLEFRSARQVDQNWAVAHLRPMRSFGAKPHPSGYYITRVNRFKSSKIFCSSSTLYNESTNLSTETMPKVRDPKRIKRPQNNYMLWAATRRPALKQLYNGKMVDVNAQLGRVSLFTFICLERS